MSDIVERLRAANTWLNEGDCCGQLDASGTCMAPACIFGEALKMANEAAARIEQLEAEGDKARARADKYRMALEDIAGLGVVCASDMALVALRGERHE